MQIVENYSLHHFGSWRVGGKVDCYFQPKDIHELIEGINNLPKPHYFLGLGSNVLIADGQIIGSVISLRKFKSTSINNNTISAQAGVPLAYIARLAEQSGCFALGFLSGIPGTLGGALTMNAGCFGFEMWQFIRTATLLDLNTYQKHVLSPNDLEVGYRKVVSPIDGIFLDAIIKMPKDGKTLTVAQCQKMRNQSQPKGTFSGGSVFKNPKNHFAGQLIEQAGLKGKSIGGAMVSEKHANFILNHTQATAQDIYQLICLIKKTVFKKFGIHLDLEVKLIGDF